MNKSDFDKAIKLLIALGLVKVLLPRKKENKSEDKSEGRYIQALEHVRYHGQTMWQIYSSFLVAHTIFLTVLLQSILGMQINSDHPSGSYLYVIYAGIGLGLCILWRATYDRLQSYYIFRMAQAREAEPTGWNLIKGDGEKFSAGEEVIIKGKPYRIKWFPRMLQTGPASWLIGCFDLAYLVIIFLDIGWMFSLF
jgi:hypothetical protein